MPRTNFHDALFFLKKRSDDNTNALLFWLVLTGLILQLELIERKAMNKSFGRKEAKVSE